MTRARSASALLREASFPPAPSAWWKIWRRKAEQHGAVLATRVCLLGRGRVGLVPQVTGLS